MRIFLSLAITALALHTAAQNIGIGTTTPSAQLHISGATTQEFILENTNTAGGGRKWGLVSLAANSGLSFQIVDKNAGIFRLGIDNNGKVGIGSPAPAALLDVAGDALINGVVIGSGNNGQQNTLLGREVLTNMTTGDGNCAVGYRALQLNTSGNYNTAIGSNALGNNVSGNYNVAIGSASGFQNNGDFNVFVGRLAGQNTTGNNNIIIGSFANSLPTVQNSVAIGASSYVTQSNSMVLGSINGVNGATADTKVGIGTTAPTTTLDVVGGIRTSYSGSNVTGTLSPGVQIVNLGIGALPAGWDHTNTALVVTNVDGGEGLIRQAKISSSTNIAIKYEALATGPVRFNYVIFKL